MEEKTPNFKKPVIISVCVLILFAVFYFVMQYVSDKNAPLVPSTVTTTEAPAAVDTTPSPTPEAEKPAEETPAATTKLTHPESMDLCEAAAKKQFGDQAMVLPNFEGKIVQTSFEGKDRECYVFVGGPIESFLSGSVTSFPAEYYIDIHTGEVYEKISGKIIK